jgi:5,10-methylenetetrahydromethanopterin reductase
MRETVEMVRALLRGGEVSMQGKVISLHGGKLLFDPLRREIPIYFATHGAQITVLAGRIADGVMIANTLDPKAFDFYAQKLAEGMAKDQRAPGSVDLALRVEACISDDDKAAFNVMQRRVTTRVLSQYPHWDYLTDLGIDLPRELVEIAQQKNPKAASEAAKWMPREVVETMVLGGNAERCASQLARALDPRITSVVLRPHAVAGDTVGAVLKKFAEHVYPRALELRAAMPAPQPQVSVGTVTGA